MHHSKIIYTITAARILMWRYIIEDLVCKRCNKETNDIHTYFLCQCDFTNIYACVLLNQLRIAILA